jgi:Tol biopolymer transport system component
MAQKPSLVMVRTLAAGALLGALAACSNDSTAPSGGAVSVTVASSGVDVSPKGFTVTVDGDSGQTVGPNATVTLGNVPAGTRSIGLAHLGSNCAVTGDNPVTVTVSVGETAAASFEVVCTARQLVFETDRNITSSGLDIYVMNDDGTGVRRVTSDPADDLLPTWSPDGSVIAFSSSRGRTGGAFNVFTMNPADGSIIHQLTDTTGENARLAFSPDGSRIAFASTRSGHAEIWVMNADGTSPTQLTHDGAFATAPSWSPDGAHIVFQSNRDGTDQLYVMDAGGGNVHRLTTTSANDHDPDWSPDGTMIVFTSNRDHSSAADSSNYEIYVMHADGSSPTRLTTNAAFDGFPAWSPDGTRIVFDSMRDGHEQIYIMDANGQNQTNLSSSASNDAVARFRP